MHPSPLPNSIAFPPKETQRPSPVLPYSLSPAPGNHSSILCPYGIAYSGHFTWIVLYNTWPFVSHSFALSVHIQSSGGSKHSFPLGMCPGTEFLGHSVGMCSPSKEMANIFYKKGFACSLASPSLSRYHEGGSWLCTCTVQTTPQGGGAVCWRLLSPQMTSQLSALAHSPLGSTCEREGPLSWNAWATITRACPLIHQQKCKQMGPRGRKDKSHTGAGIWKGFTEVVTFELGFE